MRRRGTGSIGAENMPAFSGGKRIIMKKFRFHRPSDSNVKQTIFSHLKHATQPENRPHRAEATDMQKRSYSPAISARAQVGTAVTNCPGQCVGVTVRIPRSVTLTA